MDKEIGLRIHLLRILKNVSQEKMAEDLCMSRSKGSSWETGRRDICITDAMIICNYFNVSMDNLFNPIALNSKEFEQIARRYFENDKISFEEKNDVLKKLFDYRNEREKKELFNGS